MLSGEFSTAADVEADTSITVGVRYGTVTVERTVREISAHKLDGVSDAIEVFAARSFGEPANARSDDHHCYIVGGQEIRFQNGPIGEVGVNGISNEALIAIVIDRLQRFQSGKFSCRENALALTKLEEAMHWLHHRTRDRLSRGVEGTHAK